MHPQDIYRGVRAMYSDQSQIPNGATVYDSAGDKIGTVHENNVQGAYLVVQKGFLFHKDFYVPLIAIARADEEGVHLTVSTADLSDARYDTPPMAAEAMGTSHILAPRPLQARLTRHTPPARLARLAPMSRPAPGTSGSRCARKSWSSVSGPRRRAAYTSTRT